MTCLRLRPIPACAGQPGGHFAGRNTLGAYPRVCGATLPAAHCRLVFQGLSPRVRGNLTSNHVLLTGVGPIPACAGQPARLPILNYPSRAYPRVCGATCAAALSCINFVGLSPRVRGNHAGGRGCGAGLWPIPACAGQPAHSSVQWPHSWAYPRVCGATEWRGSGGIGPLGLSPRVRGNQRSPVTGWVNWGPIPACAGQPSFQRCCFAGVGAYPRVCGATSFCPFGL